ncbi:glycosyltransferase [Paenibacillus sp. CAA11]|uniref:glycosyltransferase n=1 Tax=Paenibacillus sp. CAA11 TaxID=1532905 RepID=UPI000D35F0AA|nr:glycosyltransferase [Paenibacillus sp. CAA11]AWB46183.1 glycosyltransferase [Paenibacillus sp. CAA11]
METKILIISPDEIGKRMSGPGIRYLNFAIELAKCFKVILFSPNIPELELKNNYNFEVVHFTKQNVMRHVKREAILITQGRTIWENAYLKKIGIPLVVDLYDPFIFENLELNKYKAHNEKVHQASLSMLLEQLEVGDFFLCASEKQKDFWLGMLSSLNRVNAKEYEIDETLNHLIQVIPFGVTGERPKKTRQVLKGVHPAIHKDDILIIWGGGVWDWLDPITAIEAMVVLKSRGIDYVKLFFMGVKSPNPLLQSMKNLTMMQELSNRHGITDELVFFNDWVDFNDRHNYLLEADIGLSLHHNHIETRFSYRTRITDYIWCGLPVISTEGDIFADLITQHSIGRVIKHNNVNELVDSILSFDGKTEYEVGFSTLQKELQWQEAVKPLVEYCMNPRFSTGKRNIFKIKRMSKISFVFHKTFQLIKSKQYRLLMNKLRRFTKIK